MRSSKLKFSDLVARFTRPAQHRGTRSRNKFRRPHDGMQERHRRRLGGWAQVKRREGLTKRQYMIRQMEM